MPETTEKARRKPPWPDFAAILGKDHLRSATAADAVDGVQPQMVVEPGTAEQLAEVLQQATTAGLRVIPRGGGTKLGWGNPPQGADLIVSTLRLNRVLEHAWADMTATVEAGCTVERFQSTLAEHGQRLALDPLWPTHATIGGILATNDSGSLRVRFGALRDLIIGITLALSDGTLAKSGGKVVKNVAGYDLQKLATGSLGTLGVITRAVFRLYPVPRNVRTMSFSSGNTAELNDLMLAIQDSQMAFTGLQLRAGSDGSPQIDVRFEGTTAGMNAQARQMLLLAARVTPVDTPADAPDIWQAREALWQDLGRSVIAKFSLLPSQLSAFCSQVRKTAEGLHLAWQVVAQAVGLGSVRIAGETEEALLRAASALRKETEQLGGSLIVLHCPLGVKARLDVWGSTGDAQPLMTRIKQQLDSTGTLNRGRFVGGI